MQRFAVPAVTVVAASLLAPAASAAMADDYTPHFDPTPRHVVGRKGDGYTYPTYYELLDVPAGATWRLTGEDTTGKLMQLEQRDSKLGVRLNHNDANPPRRGENTQPLDIRVDFPDKSWDYYFPSVTLIPDHAFLYDPLYEPAEANPGDTVTLTPYNNFDRYNELNLSIPEDAKWRVSSAQGWNATIDDATGTITAVVPKNSYSGANFAVEVEFADGSKRKTTTFIRNTGVGVELPPAPEPQPAPEPAPAPGPAPEAGSSTAQKLALVFGVLAVLVGAAALAWPQLQQFLPKL